MATASKPLWEPSEESMRRTNLAHYMGWLERTRGLDPPGYHELWRWSVEDLDGFWASIWDYFDVQASRPYERVLGDRSMPGAEWFTGAELSYAEHIFRDKGDDQVAIVGAGEGRQPTEITWGELRAQVAACAEALRGAGVRRGDRVVAYMPNIPETIVAFLGCASLGATWSSCSPDFGARSVVDRFAQIEPTVLFAVDGYRYNGSNHDRRDVIGALQSQMPSLKETVVLPSIGAGEVPGAIAWENFLARGEGASLRFEQLPFDHPLWVLYSSGTTGLPKAIVHSQGGILLEHLKKLHLHVDAQAGDRLFWFTTTGWMMWNFLVGGLLTQATIVLYDGSPGAPDLDALWDLAEDTGITCFGTSAAYIAACQKAGIEPARTHDLSRLRSVGSTGSPLAREGFDWVYERVGPDTWLFSTSGGTDVCTAFVGGTPLLPVHQGELQARSLGADVQAFDESGEAVIDQVGELVITQPMPSMPVFFWNDPEGERYRDSYFEMWPGVWRHGDWIEITSRGTAIIHGRSDSTINRGGIRMGTAEIYSAVLGVDDVVDALVVDVHREDGDAWMPLFVVLREGAELDDELRGELRKRIREECSPRHVPDEVHAIAEVPRTLSGKVLEVPVKRILMGGDPDKAASRDSLANPRSLDYFIELAGQQRG